MTKDIFFCDNTKKAPAGGDKGEKNKGYDRREGGGGRLQLELKERK